ncbi:nuclear transport factor 2 family protein [Nonomuraea sp. NPDC026600]|uniref:nuclear transport factor 2 family protein n=1 Tax=Nonomuraea sp. NPDC026600 TaxID=3155363 RepID=UPI0034011B21
MTRLTVEDRIEIEELISRLCHALDFSRPEDFVAVFVPHGAFQARTSARSGGAVRFRHEGHDRLRAFADAAAAKRGGLGRHWTGNLVVRGVPGGAEATSYVMFLEIDPGTGQRTIPLSGVHHDVFSRTEAGWRFVERTIVADF